MLSTILFSDPRPTFPAGIRPGVLSC